MVTFHDGSFKNSPITSDIDIPVALNTMGKWALFKSVTTQGILKLNSVTLNLNTFRVLVFDIWCHLNNYPILCYFFPFNFQALKECVQSRSKQLQKLEQMFHILDKNPKAPIDQSIQRWEQNVDTSLRIFSFGNKEMFMENS